MLDHFHVTCEDVVYDPFVGCGTTAIAAAARECDTISCDANPIAVLVTHFKLNPPSPEDLTAMVDSIGPNGLQEAFRAFSCGVRPQVCDGHLSLLRFLLAVAVLRTRWHLGSTWDDERIASELRLLVAEIAGDTRTPLPRKAVHQINCGDFRDCGVELPLAGSRRVVIITSPPFFGSDRNPRVQRLAALLGLTWPAPTERHTGTDLSEKADRFLRSLHLTAATSREAAIHLHFLTEIVHHVTSTGCSDTAIEMSGATVGRQRVPFDEYLAACLTARGYEVCLMPPPAGRKESERLVCGHRN